MCVCVLFSFWEWGGSVRVWDGSTAAHRVPYELLQFSRVG